MINIKSWWTKKIYGTASGVKIPYFLRYQHVVYDYMICTVGAKSMSLVDLFIYDIIVLHNNKMFLYRNQVV